MSAEDQIDYLQQQIQELTGRLNAREAELAQRQAEGELTTQLQQRLDETSAILAAREETIRHFELTAPSAQAQQQIAALNERIAALTATVSRSQNIEINWNDEFQRGRLPDLIKRIPTFSGNSKILSNWIDTVEKVLKHFRHLTNTESYDLWLQDVRNKIIDEAGDLLASCGTPLNWPSIKAQLLIFYGDKRELSTLLQKLFSVKQARNTVNEFHAEILDCFTGISSQIQMSTEWKSPSELIKFVDKICLEKFVDGLEEPYSSHVGLLQPTNLNQAFQYAMEKANKVARRTGDYSISNRSNQMKPINSFRPPPIPTRTFIPKPQIPQRNFTNVYHQPFYKPIYPVQNPNTFVQRYNPNPFTQKQHPNPFTQNHQFNQPIPPRNPQLPYRPNQPFHQNKPQFHSKPEPMDVDKSIRSNRMNYMNRPHHHEQNSDQYDEYHCHEPHPEEYQEPYPEEHSEPYSDSYPEPYPESESQQQITEDNLNFQLAERLIDQR